MNLRESMKFFDILMCNGWNNLEKKQMMDGTLDESVKRHRYGAFIKNNCNLDVYYINRDIKELNLLYSMNYPLFQNLDEIAYVMVDIYGDWQSGKLGTYFETVVDLNMSSSDYWGIC